MAWRRAPNTGRATRPVPVALRVAGCVAVALGLTALSWLGLERELFAGLQQRAADAVHPRGEASPEVVVVAIDEASLIDVGLPWPWPRTVHGELIDAVAGAGAQVIAVDVLFAPEAEGDDELAAAITRAGNVLLAETVRVGPRSPRGLLTAELVSGPSPVLEDAARSSAQVAVLADPYDGVVRRVPLVIDDGRTLLPALAVAAIAATAGESATQPVVRPGAVQVGSRSIPTEADASMTVSFAPELSGDDTAAVVPAGEVLSGRADPEVFDGAVVFIGATDPTLGDRHLTPPAKQGGLAGVLVHANAYSTIASQAYLSPESTPTTLAVVLVITLACALCIQFLRLRWSVLIVVLLTAGVLSQGLVRADRGTVANFVFPLLALAVAVPVSTALRYSLEIRQRRAVSRLFSLYVPDNVAGDLLRSGLVEEAVAGQRLDISTMFCDLRGFTALSARHDPGEVREMLDHYYEFASEIVMRHQGTLMQYVGDEVFAVFGTPVPDDHHAQHATDCAAQLQEDRPRLTATLAEHGLPELFYGIGVNSGPVVAAHTGSSYRRQYTVIGDTVNTGARLCSQAGRNAVVISGATADQLDGSLPMDDMGSLEMKGVRDDFVAWRLVLTGVVAEDR